MGKGHWQNESEGRAGWTARRKSYGLGSNRPKAASAAWPKLMPPSLGGTSQLVQMRNGMSPIEAQKSSSSNSF